MHRQSRRRLEHRLERGRLDPGKHAIAQSHYARAARFAAEHPHFADAFATPDLANGLRKPVRARDMRLQAAAEQQVQCIARGAFMEKDLAAVQFHPRQVREDRGERGLVESAQKSRQDLPQGIKLRKSKLGSQGSLLPSPIQWIRGVQVNRGAPGGH